MFPIIAAGLTGWSLKDHCSTNRVCCMGCEERQRLLGLIGPEKRRLKGDLISMCKNLMKGNGEGHQPVLHRFILPGAHPLLISWVPRVGPFLQPLEVPLTDSATLWCINSSFLFWISCWGCALSYVAGNGDDEQYWHKISRSGLLQEWLFPAASYSPLSTAVKSVLEPPYSSLKSCCIRFSVRLLLIWVDQNLL